MKKILQVTTISPTVGFLTEHIKLLLKQGNEVQIATNVVSKLNKDIEKEKLVINQIDFSRKPLKVGNLKAYFQLRKLQEKENYDIVHVHTPIAAFITRLALKKFRKNNNCKIVYTAHGFHFYKGAPLKNWLLYYSAEKLASKWSDIIITMNEEDYKVALKKFSNRGYTKIFKVGGIGINIDNYINHDNKDLEFKKSLGLKEDDFVIATIGELSHRKNQIQLIKSVQKIKDRYKDIKLLIIGDGYLYKDYEKYINENNLEKNIILLGYRRDIPSILNITDVLSLVSFHEGLPRNIMEAMCNKKPVICSDIRGNTDLIKHEENGLIVGVGDIDDTSSKILKLYDNRELIKNMGEKSFKYIQKFSEENVLKEMDIAYKNII